MRDSRLNHTTRHMFLTLGGFVVAILLLEPDGLQNWAERLEPGLLRTIAVPAVSALDRTVQPLGLAGFRDRTLDEAARIGWSDDAVRTARMATPSTVQAAVSQTPASHASTTSGSTLLRAQSRSILS